MKPPRVRDPQPGDQILVRIALLPIPDKALGIEAGPATTCGHRRAQIVTLRLERSDGRAFDTHRVTVGEEHCVAVRWLERCTTDSRTSLAEIALVPLSAIRAMPEKVEEVTP